MDPCNTNRTVLLSSGQCMPVIGLGMFQTKDPDELTRAVSSALEVGYRHFDTAFTYRNEDLLGKALHKAITDRKVKREDLFIVTKLPHNGLRPDAVEYFFQKSRTDLQLDYIDLYLIHFPVAAKRSQDDYAAFPMKNGVFDADETIDLTETWKMMESLVDRGLVKSIGISNFNSQQIQRIYDSARIKPAVLQVECHAYLPQFELHELCKRLKIALTAYSPIGAPGQSEFNDNASQETRLIDDSKLKPLCEKYGKSSAQTQLSCYSANCHERKSIVFHLADLAETLLNRRKGEWYMLNLSWTKSSHFIRRVEDRRVLLRYLVQRGIIVIPKSANPKRLKENIQIFDFTLSDDDMEILKSMARNRRYFSFESYNGLTDHPEYPFRIPF